MYVLHAYTNVKNAKVHQIIALNARLHITEDLLKDLIKIILLIVIVVMDTWMTH